MQQNLFAPKIYGCRLFSLTYIYSLNQEFTWFHGYKYNDYHSNGQFIIEYFKPIFKKYGEELKNFLAKRTVRKVLMFQKKPGPKIPERITNRFRDVANTKTLQEYLYWIKSSKRNSC